MSHAKAVRALGGFDVFNVGIDLYCALICALMAVYILRAPHAGSRSASRCFAGMCVANAVMALGDTTSWMPAPPLDDAGFALVLAGSFVYYAAVVPIYVLLSGYLVAYFTSGARPASKTPRRTVALSRRALVLPIVVCALYACVCIASLFCDLLFTVTREGGYERGPVFWFSQASVVILHLYNTLLIISRRRLMTKRERFAFACWVILPALANGFQVLSFGVAILNPVITVALLIMFMCIESERRALLAERECELAEMRGAVMLSQIQPHFLYNALTAIRELCRTDGERAAEVVTDFAVYLRQNMRSLDSKAPIPFERELEHVKTYLMLEGYRYGERLRWRFDIGERAFSLPPLLVQPLVENAVRHGIAPRPGGGSLILTTRAEGAWVRVIVEDDGVGFDAHAARDGEHVGIESVRRRVALMCGGSLAIESAPGHGTRAVLSIPRTASEG